MPTVFPQNVKAKQYIKYGGGGDTIKQAVQTYLGLPLQIMSTLSYRYKPGTDDIANKTSTTINLLWPSRSQNKKVRTTKKPK